MGQTLTVQEKTYYIAHKNGEEVRIHAGILQEGKQLTTAMTELEEYYNEEEWEDRLEELGYEFDEEGW